jgi:hypothetical protein
MAKANKDIQKIQASIIEDFCNHSRFAGRFSKSGN